MDAIARFRVASEKADIDEMMDTLAPDAELISPISGRMVFRGHEDVRVLLGAVYRSLRGLRWTEEIGDGRLRLVMGECRIGPLKLTDAMVFELAEDGQIRRIRPHLRPWLALTWFALTIGAKVGRRPDVIRRALRAGS